MGPAFALAVACACSGSARPERLRLIDALPNALEVPSAPQPGPLAVMSSIPSAAGQPWGIAFPVEALRGFVLRARLRSSPGAHASAHLYALDADELATFGASPHAVATLPATSLGPCHVTSTGVDGVIICQRFDHVGPDKRAILWVYQGVDGAGSVVELWDAAMPDRRVPENPLLDPLVRRVGHVTSSGVSWRSVLVGRGRYIFELDPLDSPQLWFATGYEQGSPSAPTRFIVRQDSEVVFDEVTAVDDAWHDHRVPLKPARSARIRLELETQPAGAPEARPPRAVWGNPRLVSSRTHLPNVLLVTLDAVRPDHLPSYGYRRDTAPTLEEISRAGVQFERATAQGGRTWESLAALLTGLYPAHNRVRAHGVPLPADIPTLPELLSRQGFETFGGSDMGLYPPILESSFDEAEIVPVVAPGSPQRQLKRLAPALHRGGLFAWFHLENAHSPLTPTEPFRYDAPYVGRFASAFTRQEHDAFTRPDSVTAAEQAHLAALYDASIRDADHELKGLLSTLNDENQLDNTLLIVTADHGEQLGEHGAVVEHVAPYDAVLHVPLLFAWEGHVHPGTRVTARVQLVDVVPTVLALLGVHSAVGFDGRDLSAGLSGQALPDAPAYAEALAQVFSSYHGSQHFLWAGAPFKARFPDGWQMSLAADELYDLSSDPAELHDLAPEQPARAAQAARELKARIDQWREPPQTMDAPLSQAALEALQQAGYLKIGDNAVSPR